MQSKQSKVDILLANNAVAEEWKSILFIPRFKQRLAIVDAWSIELGSRVLDIGVGQGDSSVVLALELGPVCTVILLLVSLLTDFSTCSRSCSIQCPLSGNIDS